MIWKTAALGRRFRFGCDRPNAHHDQSAQNAPHDPSPPSDKFASLSNARSAEDCRAPRVSACAFLYPRLRRISQRTGAPAMTKRNMALGAHFKTVIAASFLTLTIAAAAAAFAIGFTGALNQSLADPDSAPIARIAALRRLDEALGYDGFLRAYRT